MTGGDAIHPPKHETFDLRARTNTDPKGIVRAVDDYTVRPWGLYLARPTPGRAQFHYLESWLLPSLGLRATVFHFSPGHERDHDYYLDVGEYTPGPAVWSSEDHYLDLEVRTNVGLDLADVDELLDAVRGKDEIDIIRDIAYPLPAAVISDMLGVPPDGREQFRQWAEDIMAFTGGGALALPMIAESAQKSLFEMYDYFGSLIRKRRSHPQNDLISALTQIEEQGDRLTEEDLLGLCDQLLTAGHDTTRNLIGNGMLALLENEEQLQRLRKDPSLVAAAVEELLRFDSPLQRQTRVAKEDFELHGNQICKGQPILSMLGAANRDPSRFEGPNRLDICRRNNGHVAFGSGIHYCLGAPLSRLEGHIAFNSIAQRFPTIRLASSVPQWRENMSVRGLTCLPCTL